MIYVEIIDNKITCSTPFEDVAQQVFKEYITTNFEDFSLLDNKYIYDENKREIVLNPDYETEQNQKERERIAMLSLTRGDVFRGLLQAKGITRNQIRVLLEAMPETTDYERLAKELALIDFDEALDFYRGNTLIDILGEQLEISKTQLDNFFQTNDFRELIKEED